MTGLLPILFAGIAAIGNAFFALAQRQAAGIGNGLLFVAASALTACLLALAVSPLIGPVDAGTLLRGHWKMILLGGAGLFLTYLGFNLLYSRYGAAPYVLYAMLSIATTTVVVGFLWLKEPINLYHAASLVAAGVAVLLFSIGQSRV